LREPQQLLCCQAEFLDRVAVQKQVEFGKHDRFYARNRFVVKPKKEEPRDN
jgi:hypothetical protein